MNKWETQTNGLLYLVWFVYILLEEYKVSDWEDEINYMEEMMTIGNSLVDWKIPQTFNTIWYVIHNEFIRFSMPLLAHSLYER
jgi:hypothetical protein